jgi:LAS superfamily LD-carboxypeptidase LdcB
VPVISPTTAKENSTLQNTLQWDFGGKRQRGWYLYSSLIQHTINTQSSAETVEFAHAVLIWQQKEGIYPSGMVDGETISRLIEIWQSNRLNSSVYAAPEDLMSAPIANFYDPTRDVELLKVERETYKAYKRMVAAAARELKLKTDQKGELSVDEKYLRIVSAFRSREYQAKLRRASPQSGRAALAFNSPHFTGRTLDIYVGGEPTITKEMNRAVQIQTPVYKWLVKNAARFGFYPYFYEPWHWEYVPQNLRTPDPNAPVPTK